MQTYVHKDDWFLCTTSSANVRIRYQKSLEVEDTSRYLGHFGFHETAHLEMWRTKFILVLVLLAVLSCLSFKVWPFMCFYVCVCFLLFAVTELIACITVFSYHLANFITPTPKRLKCSASKKKCLSQWKTTLLFFKATQRYLHLFVTKDGSGIQSCTQQ